MTKSIRCCIVAPISLLLAIPVSAAPLSVGITGGTLGIGPQVGYRVSESFGIRADATFLGISHKFDQAQFRYDGHVSLKSGGLMADLYPFGGGLRISAGARYNGNKAHAVATPSTSASVGGQTFTPAQIGTLRGDGSVKDFAPALTVGYNTSVAKSLMIGLDAGALFQGGVRVSRFTSSTGLIPQARLDQERADRQHDIGRYKVYPILQLNIGYQF